jgi:hypothetical protein
MDLTISTENASNVVRLPTTTEVHRIPTRVSRGYVSTRSVFDVQRSTFNFLVLTSFFARWPNRPLATPPPCQIRMQSRQYMGLMSYDH